MRNVKSPRLFTVVFAVILQFQVYAQGDLMSLLEEGDDTIVNYTFATFKNTRLITGHSVETNAEGVLQFNIGHRFGRVNSGWRNLFGIDNSTIRMEFQYGITDRLNIGLSRSSFQKTYDGMIKYKLLRQKTGAETFPFTATVVSNMYCLANEWPNPDRENYFSSRLSYHHSLLLARKFGGKFSFQFSPTVVHRNLVRLEGDRNTVFSLGSGASLELTGSLRLNAESFLIFPGQFESKIGGETVKSAFSIGVDLETGGHVFQMHLTNSRGMTEKILIGETTGSWANGDIHFGFNISRVFTANRK